MTGAEGRATGGAPAQSSLLRPGELLARVEQTLWVEDLLDRLVHGDRSRLPLIRELAVFHQADTVLPRDRAFELDREREELVGRLLGALELGRLIEVDHERGVEVAVAGVAPAARLELVPASDLDGLDDRLVQAIDRNHDVLAYLAAALGGHGEGGAVTPAPQAVDVLDLGWGVDQEGLVG